MNIGTEKLTESRQEKSVNHVTEEKGLPRFAELWDADVGQHFLLQNLLCVLDTLLLCYTWKLPKFCWGNHILNEKVWLSKIFFVFFGLLGSTMICFLHFVAGNLSKFTRPCSSGSDKVESDVLFLNDESLVQRRFDLKENQNISSCNKILYVGYVQYRFSRFEFYRGKVKVHVKLHLKSLKK